ncbi:SWIM zinc finger family protein [Natronococcus jeotgali]|uniref:SWIM zinc finger family protein n=1 Tax=Natronococcus jeotgali TaxID=413812 RepID=UPI001EF9DDFB|nr:SWIM zinc finger family protein [Natronococcus jeotgali]
MFGTTLSDYDPTELVGSNRPLIKYRDKHKYAELVLELERTGHGFSAEGITALEKIRSNYSNQVDDDNTHQTDVTLEVGMTPRTITIKGIFPEDSSSIIGSCWDTVSDPDKWFPIGWPEQGWIHRRSADPEIPGDEPVVDAFPRLQTQTPAHSVDLETIREVTEPGRYERGSRYYERGSVTNIEYVDNSLQATVQGSRPYTVQVTLSEGSYASGQCSCPDDTVPCKHIVAAVLASGDVEPVGSGQSIDTLLETASAKELRTVLTELADEDLRLRRRLYERLGED